MKSKRGWARPGWPWELEVLAIVFALMAMLIPYFTEIKPPDIEGLSILEGQKTMNQFVIREAWRSQRNMMWILGMLVVYSVHLGLALRTTRLVSTPLIHLFTPAIFMSILYVRLAGLVAETESGTETLVTGQFAEGATWVFLVLAFTYVVARVRMARYLLYFKGVNWAFTTPARKDRSFFSLMQHLTPLFYPPRLYHIFPDGIVIEGYLYALALPFTQIQSTTRINPKAPLTRGLFLASSRRRLICLKHKSHQVSIYLSPREPKAILDYISRRVAAMKPELTQVRPVLED